MAIRQIRVLGDDVLRKKCKEVKEMTPRMHTLVEDMYDTMYEAMGVGLASRAVEEAIAYAKTRVQFKAPIANLQAIQMMIADLSMQVEAARQLVYHTAELIDAKLPYAKFSSMSKCFGADIAMKVAIDALQIFGGYGYMKEYPMEKLVRDAKILQIYEGTNQIQRVIIAKEVLR